MGPYCPIGWSNRGLGLPLQGSPGAAAVGLVICVPLLGSVAGWAPRFKCHKFGHGREKCRRQEPICGKCEKVGHAADSCKNDPHCVNCRGDHAASDKVCPKYAEEQDILRYRAYNGRTFQQARAAVVLEVAKEVRPRTYAQVTKRETTRAPVDSANAPDLTSKAQQVTPGTRGVTRKRVSTPAKITSNESKKAQKNDNRYGTEANFEELLDLTKRCNVGIMAIQDSKLPEGWAPPRGFQLLSSEDPSRGASLFIGNSMRATKINLNTNLVAEAARISCPKAVT
ncbi:nucleic-acid-binding protein from mobile element jockey, partial [Elysia marginata]